MTPKSEAETLAAGKRRNKAKDLHAPGNDELLSVTELPFETEQLRNELQQYLDQKVDFPEGFSLRLGAIRWGVYAFFDYDAEPIYVGQTKEMLGTRIRRHLTNQRTDAVAMHVLDPFEVRAITVWPLPQFEDRPRSDAEAIAHLNALEYAVFHDLLKKSEFQAVLNEKDPSPPALPVLIPVGIFGLIVPEAVSSLRDHPDLRIARRAATLARLAQVISERKVQKGLRRTLLAQARRLESLAKKRYDRAVDAPSDGDGVL